MYRHISACVFAISLVGSVPTLWAQSLADVSRAEEERRKNIKAPAKVYTNKDLTSASLPTLTTATDGTTPVPADQAATSAGASTEQPVAEAPPAGPTFGGKDQDYWAGRSKDLQAQLERDRSYAEALQSRINALTTDFTNRDDPAQRAVVEQDRIKALADLERLNQTIQNDQKALTDLDEEARRAGVPPGWLR